MSIRRLVFWITLMAVFAMAVRISIDSDTWWHLRTAAWILENGSVPRADPFSYTRLGEPWPHPGWIVQVPMLLIYRGLGPGGLNLWVAGMVTLAYLYIWRAMQAGVFLKAFVIVLGAATAGVYWAARPYMASFVLAALFLWVLEDYRWGRRDRLWWLPLAMIVWVNSHGGFVIGILIWGVYGVGLGARWLGRSMRIGTQSEDEEPAGDEAGSESARAGASFADSSPAAVGRMLLIGLLLLVAVLINPNGATMLAYPLQTVEIQALQDFIQEWQSPDFHQLQVHPFIWLLLLTFAAAAASRKGLELVDFLLVAGFAYLGLLAGRNLALFGLAAPIVLARHAGPVLASWAAQLEIRLRANRPGRQPGWQGGLNWLLLALLFLAVVIKAALVFPAAENQKAFDEFLPVEAVAFLREYRPPGALFNSYNWGAYLLWALPEYPVFVDGRTDLYDDEVIGQWFQVVRAEPGWEETLSNWQVNTILLEPHMPVVALLEMRGWQLLHQDERAVVYGR